MLFPTPRNGEQAGPIGRGGGARPAVPFAPKRRSTMERKNAWKTYSPQQLEELNQLADDYREFISRNKTERECTD